MDISEVVDDQVYTVTVLRAVKFGAGRPLLPDQKHTMKGFIIKQLPADAIEVTSLVG